MWKEERVPNKQGINTAIKEVHYVDEVIDSVYSLWYSKVWHSLLRSRACVSWCKQITYAKVSIFGLLKSTIDFNIKHLTSTSKKLIHRTAILVRHEVWSTKIKLNKKVIVTVMWFMFHDASIINFSDYRSSK